MVLEFHYFQKDKKKKELNLCAINGFMLRKARYGRPGEASLDGMMHSTNTLEF